MSDISLDVFPARVNGPDGLRSDVRAIIADGRLFMFDRSPSLVAQVPVESIDDTQRRRGVWTLVDDEGRSWSVMRSGGCGCGNLLKRVTAASLLALVPA